MLQILATWGVFLWAPHLCMPSKNLLDSRIQLFLVLLAEFLTLFFEGFGLELDHGHSPSHHTFLFNHLLKSFPVELFDPFLLLRSRFISVLVDGFLLLNFFLKVSNSFLLILNGSVSDLFSLFFNFHLFFFFFLLSLFFLFHDFSPQKLLVSLLFLNFLLTQLLKFLFFLFLQPMSFFLWDDIIFHSLYIHSFHLFERLELSLNQGFFFINYACVYWGCSWFV